MNFKELYSTKTRLDEGKLGHRISEERATELGFDTEQTETIGAPYRVQIYTQRIEEWEGLEAVTKVEKKWGEVGDPMFSGLIPGNWKVKKSEFDWDGEELEKQYRNGVFGLKKRGSFEIETEDSSRVWSSIKDALSDSKVPSTPNIGEFDGELWQRLDGRDIIRMSATFLYPRTGVKRTYGARLEEKP